jgi:hypothetical protein
MALYEIIYIDEPCPTCGGTGIQRRQIRKDYDDEQSAVAKEAIDKMPPKESPVVDEGVK